MGISHTFAKSWTVGLDGFYKNAHNLIDLGQFGQALILSPYNYDSGYDYGAEFSTNYKAGPISLYGNFAWTLARGKDIVSNQYLFGPDELAYISDHYIPLDHESEFTASAGVSYEVTKNDLVYGDMLLGSGLRTGFANLMQEPTYWPFNFGYQHIFHLSGSGNQTVRVRFDLINAFDQVYQIQKWNRDWRLRAAVRAASFNLHGSCL